MFILSRNIVIVLSHAYTSMDGGTILWWISLVGVRATFRVAAHVRKWKAVSNPKALEAVVVVTKALLTRTNPDSLKAGSSAASLVGKLSHPLLSLLCSAMNELSVRLLQILWVSFLTGFILFTQLLPSLLPVERVLQHILQQSVSTVLVLGSMQLLPLLIYAVFLLLTSRPLGFRNGTIQQWWNSLW